MTWAFIPANLGLTFGLLDLFIGPLRNTANAINHSNHEISKRMCDLAWYHAKLTLIAVVSATATAAHFLVAGIYSNEDLFGNAYYMEISLAVFIIDLIINGSCAKCMSNIWMPRAIRINVRAASSNHTKISSKKATFGHVTDCYAIDGLPKGNDSVSSLTLCCEHECFYASRCVCASAWM